MIYLSSTTRQFFEYGQPFGCMFNSCKRTARQLSALMAGVLWMLDNGAFSGKWEFAQWLAELKALREFVPTCLGVIVPDVKFDWEATLKRFFENYYHVERFGYKVAYATQDGQPIDKVPWYHIQTLFVGGSNDHKRGPEGEALALEAKRRGKWVHVGRVNGGESIVQFWPWADSWDGTTFSHHPTQQVGPIKNGIHTVSMATHQARKLL